MKYILAKTQFLFDDEQGNYRTFRRKRMAVYVKGDEIKSFNGLSDPETNKRMKAEGYKLTVIWSLVEID